jgi:dTDP-4-dehydrorhamnose 3,5-epimerase-like enzyme
MTNVLPNWLTFVIHSMRPVLKTVSVNLSSTSIYRKTAVEFKKIAVESFKDHRASRFFDLYPQMSGQVTTSVIEPFQFSGWHKHALQYDQFFVADGKIKVVTISPEGDVQEHMMSSGNGMTLQIPAGYWHCYHSAEEKAVLIYYLSRKHDESDEIRASKEDIFEQFGYMITA